MTDRVFAILPSHKELLSLDLTIVSLVGCLQSFRLIKANLSSPYVLTGLLPCTSSVGVIRPSITVIHDTSQ